MQAWVWGALGLVCLGVETLSAGSFVFVFFGIAALMVGGLSALAITEDVRTQSLVFVAATAVSMAVLRRRLRRAQYTQEESDGRPLGGRQFAEMATAAEPILPAQIGQVELRGTVWRGLNAGASTLQMGQSYRVVRIDNLTVVLMDRGPNGEMR